MSIRLLEGVQNVGVAGATVSLTADFEARLVSSNKAVYSTGRAPVSRSGVPVLSEFNEVTKKVIISVGSTDLLDELGIVQPTTAFDPSTLFTNGVKGAVYDFSDATQLSQDNLGQTPVTSVTQTVGRVNDLSGNGNHLLQATSGARPTYMADNGAYGVKLDGTNDFLSTASFGLTDTAGITVLIAARQIGSGTSVVVSHGRLNGAAGIEMLYNNSVNALSAGAHDGTNYLANAAPVRAAPTSYVATALYSTAGLTNAERISVKIDGIDVTENQIASSGTINTGIYSTQTLYVGARSGTSLFNSMEIYGLLIINRILTASELSNVTNWMLTRSLQPVFSDGNILSAGADYRKTDAFSRASYETAATSVDLTLVNDIYGSYPQFTEVGVFVNGRYHANAAPGAAGETTHTVSLPSGDKTVDLVVGLQSKPSSTIIGTYLKRAVFNASAINNVVSSRKRIVIYGDSISVGGNANKPCGHSYAMRLREASDYSVVVCGYGSRTLYDDCSTPEARSAFVATIAGYFSSDMIAKKLWIAIGTNDYGLNKWSPADFGVAYAALIDGLTAAISGLQIYTQTPLTRTTETANTFSATLGDYRTQISTIAASRSVTIVDGPQILSTGDLDDDLHPSTAGHGVYASKVKKLASV